MSKVDLAKGSEGLLTLRDGTTGYTYWEYDKKSDSYDVRYESGWYVPYSRTGKKLSAGWIVYKDGRPDEEIPASPLGDIVAVEFRRYADGDPSGFHP
jgi:hypothetical protein